MVDHAGFQNQIYFQGLADTLPAYPIAFADLEAAAAEHLDAKAMGYVQGGAGSGDTMRENLEAFRRWRIVPRHMQDVAERDLTTSVLGLDLPAPFLLAPVGVQSIVHEEAEAAVADGAAATGVPIVLSTVSSVDLETVAEHMGEVPRWFQLYWPDDPEVAVSLVQRAEAAGYSAIVVTLDTKLLAWRPRDLATAYLPFLHGEGLANYRTDPAFLGDIDPEDDQAVILRWIQIFSDKSVGWDDLALLRENTTLPIVLKGVLHPDDARTAADHGVDSVIVSNHGGRQVDGSIGALDALPAVADAVGDELTVLFDSGVRTGSDVFKALALGAEAVLLGRPYIYGLALGGAAGVEHVIRCLLAELDLTMALSGVTTIDQITRDRLLQR